MASVQGLCDEVIDYAERLSQMADAAQGKQRRHEVRSFARWVVLPAVGAGLFAFARSEYLSRRAKGVVDEAKSRASELPDDLIARVHETTAPTRSGSNTRSRRSSSTARNGKSRASKSRTSRSSSKRA